MSYHPLGGFDAANFGIAQALLDIEEQRGKREEKYVRRSFFLSLASLFVAGAAFCIAAFNWWHPSVHHVRMVDGVHVVIDPQCAVLRCTSEFQNSNADVTQDNSAAPVSNVFENSSTIFGGSCNSIESDNDTNGSNADTDTGKRRTDVQ